MQYMKLSFFSDVLQREANVSIYYPDVMIRRTFHGPQSEGMDLSPRPGYGYQILYLIPGGGGSYMSWPLNANLMGLLEKQNLVTVVPTIDDHLGERHIGDNMEYIVNELRNYLTSILPISPKRDDNFIAGFSLCGYFAWRCGLLHPDKFAAVCTMCSPVDIVGDITERHSCDSGSPDSIIGTDRDLLILTEKLVNQGVDLPRFVQTFGTTDFANGVNRHAIEVFEKCALPNWEWIELEGGHNYSAAYEGLKYFLSTLKRDKELVRLEEQ